MNIGWNVQEVRFILHMDIGWTLQKVRFILHMDIGWTLQEVMIHPAHEHRVDSTEG